MAFHIDLDKAPLETARFLAVLSLITYHVIGSAPSGGLHIDYPHPLRFGADFLADLRMPLFAFISGYLYAWKPVQPGHLARFLLGKAERIAVPGVIGILAFVLSSQALGTRFALDQPVWEYIVFPYAHFWFLQAIIVIFGTVCVLDIVTKGRFLLPMFVLVCVLYLVGRTPGITLLSLHQSLYLLPYFLLGIVFVRHGGRLGHRELWLVGMMSVGAVVWATVVNLQMFEATGRLDGNRYDLQSLAFGLGACLLCFLVLPRLPWLTGFGALSFTIYIYRVFGTSGARRLLDALGVVSFPLHVLVGVLLGFLVPVAIHVAAARLGVTRRLVLGLRH